MGIVAPRPRSAASRNTPRLSQAPGGRGRTGRPAPASRATAEQHREHRDSSHGLTGSAAHPARPEDGATATPPPTEPATTECLPHRYAIAATALNSTLLLCCRPMVLTLLLRSPAFCSALSADFAVFGSLLPVHGHLHAPRPILFFRVPPRFATLLNSAAMKQFIS